MVSANRAGLVGTSNRQAALPFGRLQIITHNCKRFPLVYCFDFWYVNDVFCMGKCVQQYSSMHLIPPVQMVFFNSEAFSFLNSWQTPCMLYSYQLYSHLPFGNLPANKAFFTCLDMLVKRGCSWVGLLFVMWYHSILVDPANLLGRKVEIMMAVRQIEGETAIGISKS